MELLRASARSALTLLQPGMPPLPRALRAFSMASLTPPSEGLAVYSLPVALHQNGPGVSAAAMSDCHGNFAGRTCPFFCSSQLGTWNTIGLAHYLHGDITYLALIININYLAWR